MNGFKSAFEDLTELRSFVKKNELQQPYKEQDVQRSLSEWLLCVKSMTKIDFSLVKKDVLEAYFYASIRWTKYFRRVKFVFRNE
jgi:type IV secretory pathway TrbF-like protein